MCEEFRQVCGKIGACWVISGSARSQNIRWLVFGGLRQSVRACTHLNQLKSIVRVTYISVIGTILNLLTWPQVSMRLFKKIDKYAAS